jgi:hypothetical protein
MAQHHFALFRRAPIPRIEQVYLRLQPFTDDAGFGKCRGSCRSVSG